MTPLGRGLKRGFLKGLEGGLKGDLKGHLNFDLIQHFKAVASADICSLEPSSLSLWTSSSSDRQSPKQPRKQPNKRARKLTYMQTSLHTCLHACTPTYIHVRSSIQCANARMSRHSIYITTCVLLRVHKCLSCPRLSASLFFAFFAETP